MMGSVNRDSVAARLLRFYGMLRLSWLGVRGRGPGTPEDEEMRMAVNCGGWWDGAGGSRAGPNPTGHLILVQGENPPSCRLVVCEYSKKHPDADIYKTKITRPLASQPSPMPLQEPRRHRNHPKPKPNLDIPPPRPARLPLLFLCVRLGRRRRGARVLREATHAVEGRYGGGGCQGGDGGAAVFVLGYVGHLVVGVEDDLVRISFAHRLLEEEGIRPAQGKGREDG